MASCAGGTDAGAGAAEGAASAYSSCLDVVSAALGVGATRRLGLFGFASAVGRAGVFLSRVPSALRARGVGMAETRAPVGPSSTSGWPAGPRICLRTR